MWVMLPCNGSPMLLADSVLIHHTTSAFLWTSTHNLIYLRLQSQEPLRNKLQQPLIGIGVATCD